MSQDDEMQVDGDQPKTGETADVKDDIISSLETISQAVQQFDVRFILRALRAVPSIRKRLGSPAAARDTIQAVKERRNASQEQKAKKNKTETTALLPEEEVYLAVLEQVVCFHAKEYKAGAKFCLELVEKIRTYNRRTLDPLGARVYFYLQLFHEQIGPPPPSKESPVFDIREKLLQALRSAVLRKDRETEATTMVLLLRNYISTADITQADLLIEHNQFPTTASNNQVARYLYYFSRVRAIQLQYSTAHDNLLSAIRKAPSTGPTAGFNIAATKLLVVIQLLMGDIPERSTFRQPRLEAALAPYFALVQSVRSGDLPAFEKAVTANAAVFRKDGTYTLTRRLRQNVIRTGVRMLSLAYSRITLRDICIRLGIDNEQSAEYIVAKAIRDGVIEASINHERGYMETKRAGDVYATREPAQHFHDRIQACLGLHDECVKAMRFPHNGRREELKSVKEAKERERELAKEIVDGDVDEDDLGGDYEGM